MKIITLNTWGGRAGKEALRAFFVNHKDDVDIFCLQEIWSAPYQNLDGMTVGGKSLDHSTIMTEGLQELSEILSDFTPYFRPHHGDNYGLLTFVRKTVEVAAEGELFVHKYKDFIPEGDIGKHARNIQYVTVSRDGTPCTVINFHGLWNGLGKGDSEDRLEQSRNILAFTAGIGGHIVLCGDFNLSPDTESMRMLESSGFRNLISEYGVTSTRTSLYTYTTQSPFADYVLVSEGIMVADFKVLPDEVSDHAPLYLEIT